VAIKVLQEDAGQAAELLDEARVMASVNDAYCVPVVAICMTAQLMLLTQLMPLGSLLDYVRAQKAAVDSHTLLIWATQIAKVGVYKISKRVAFFQTNSLTLLHKIVVAVVVVNITHCLDL
jgi:epidermal growth factor receptor